MGGYKLVSVQDSKKLGSSIVPACGEESVSPQKMGDIGSIYEEQGLVSGKTEVPEMYKTFRTTDDTIMAGEIENTDIKLKIIIDLQNKAYLMVERQEKIAIYDLSLVGYVTEIVNDVSFEEYREVTYARLDKELLEQGIKPRKINSLRFDRKYFIEEDSTDS